MNGVSLSPAGELKGFMPRAKTDSEKFRAFITGKTSEDLVAMMERLQDVLAVMTPPKQEKRKPKRNAAVPAQEA